MLGLGLGIEAVIKDKALQFDGVNDKATATFTEDVAEVSFYLKPLDGTSQNIIWLGGSGMGTKAISYTTGSGSGDERKMSTNALANYVRTVDGVTDTSLGELTLNMWSHVKITFTEITASTLVLGGITTYFGEFAIHSLELKDSSGVVVGKYPLNEGTGTTAYDTSGNGAHFTLEGGAEWVDV